MARRKKGRDISGWVVVDKPVGVTSTTVVNKVRWAFDARKAGHAGTLDPEATGILAIALGEATKTVPYVTDAMKAYQFSITFGAATSTDDSEGETIATSERRPSQEELQAALPEFTGDIMQVPPAFSAIKVDGARAYSKARAGEDVKLAARPLFVESLELIERPDAKSAVLQMVCGKGGYVRAIARDLGRRLGCYAHVASLRRIWSGPFELEDTILLDEIERMARTPDLDAVLLPLSAGLIDLPQLPTTIEGATRLRNGNPGIVIAAAATYGDLAWASFDGEPIAVGIYKAGELHPTRVFRM